jgi:hypothetical protein
MLPEDRLDEAIQQVDIVLDSERLTSHEEEWLEDASRDLKAVAAILERQRQQRDDAEVVTE